MKADYLRLKNAVERAVIELRNGKKTADRARRVELNVIDSFESEITTGEYTFRLDAALDAGGTARYARPMDHVLGGLLSCIEMWCLRWAALNDRTIENLKLAAVGRFNWRGEYLEEMDAGLIAIDIVYTISDPALTLRDLQKMTEMVARRCPVYATLRKATLINEEICLNEHSTAKRQWLPGADEPVAV